MRTFSALFLITLLFTIDSHAQDTPSAEQLVQAAHQLADLSQNGSYVLTATVVVNPGAAGKETSGRLTIYRDHDRSRTELQILNQQELRVSTGNKTYIMKGQYLESVMGLAGFDQSWDPLYLESPLTIKSSWYSKPAKDSRNGIEAWCFDKHRGQGVQSKNGICIGSLQRVLLERSGGGKTDFLDYTSIGKSMFPGHVVIHKDLMFDFEVRDISISFQHVDKALFALPPNAIELERCDNIQPPKAVHTPEPEFPEKARKKRHQGSVVLHALIGADGKVDFVKALSNGRDGFEQNAEAAMHKWKFKPATCDGHPVVMEMNVEVAFNLFN